MWLVYAAGAACCFGLRGILYQWTSKQPADRNVLLFGVYLSGAVIALFLNGGLGQAWTAGAAVGVAMGAFSFISNSSMHKGFAVGKASLVALLSGLPPLVVVLIAFALWGEKLTWMQGLAFAIILGGGLLIKSSGGLSFQDLKGAQWGLLAMFTFALTDLSSKQAVLWGGEALPTVAVMYLTGSLMFGLTAWKSVRGARGGREEQTAAVAETAAGQTIDTGARVQLVARVAALSDGERAISSGHPPALHSAARQLPAESAAPTAAPAVKRWSMRKTLLVGMFVGISNSSGVILMMPAMKLGVTGLVSAIIALNVLLILFYARVVLKERFTPLVLTGMAMAFGGVLVLRLFG